eukprot:6180847-Pleurochrysis_carterae.AAC.4
MSKRRDSQQHSSLLVHELQTADAAQTLSCVHHEVRYCDTHERARSASELRHLRLSSVTCASETFGFFVAIAGAADDDDGSAAAAAAAVLP